MRFPAFIMARIDDVDMPFLAIETSATCNDMTCACNVDPVLCGFAFNPRSKHVEYHRLTKREDKGDGWFETE